MRHKTSRWNYLRKIVQIIFLVAWLVWVISTARLSLGINILRLPTQVDPLLALAQGIASRTLTGGMLLGLITIFLTFIFGRVWCGWICPIGTVLDFFPFRKLKKNPKRSDFWRKGKYLTLTAVLVAAIFGNLSLIILDPITLWFRSWTGGLMPGLNNAFSAAEYGLSNISWLSDPLQQVDQVMRPAIFPVDNVGIRFVWLPVVLLAAVILLNLIAERFWCRSLCPLGGLLGAISKIAIFKRTVKQDCKSCNQCITVCPTDTIDPTRNYQSDPAECIMCLKCLDGCTQNQTDFQPHFSLPEKMRYDPSRRDFLITGGVTLASLALLDTHLIQRNRTKFNLRPPGVTEQELLEKCMRCGLCTRACPTGALQPAVTESGIIGLFTPVVVPRLGYCLYSCNNCGAVCPVGEIPPLSLEEKQHTAIGYAFIDQNRCIPWADGVNCIVCEEMCPLPEKAIWLSEEQVLSADGKRMRVKLPHVNRDLCIGCGICEYKCPREGEAAIRVFQKE